MRRATRALLSFFVGNLRPKLLRQQIHVRFHVNARARHLLFVHAQHFSQTVELLAHIIEHGADGVHLHVAALVTFQRVADGDVLSQLQ